VFDSGLPLVIPETKVLWIVAVPSETFPPPDVAGKPVVEFS